MKYNITYIGACSFGNNRIENDRKHGVLKLIVNLNMIDANMECNIALRPGISNPQSIQCLPFNAWSMTFLVIYFTNIFIQCNILSYRCIKILFNYKIKKSYAMFINVIFLLFKYFIIWISFTTSGVSFVIFF